MQRSLIDKVEEALSAIDWHTKTRTDFLPAEWTKDIKARLAKLGFEEGYSVWSSGVQEMRSGDARIANQEWLYDMAWINYKGQGLEREMKSLPLAMESELPLRKATKYERVLEDFEKLIVSQANIKVMVFQLDKEFEVMDQFRKLERHVDHFRSFVEEEYLLTGIAWLEEKMMFHRFTPTKKTV